MAESQITFSKAQLKTKDGRSRLAQLLSQLVVQSATGTVLENRWKTCEDQYDATPNSSGSEIVNGVKDRPVNIVAPRIDAAEDAIAASNIGVKPYAQCLMEDTYKDSADALEKGLQEICDTERFGESYRQLIHDALIRGCGIVDIEFNTAAGKIEFTPIDPRSFRVYPNSTPWFDKTEFAAHQISITRAELQDLIAQKKLQKPNETDSDSIAAAQFGAATEFIAPRADFDGDSISSPFYDFDIVQLWDCKIRLRVGKERTWFRVVYHYESQSVLMVEPWPYDGLGYVICYLDIDYNRFYPNSSQAYRLCNLQHAYTDAWSMLSLGTEMEAFPAVMGTLGGADKNIKIEPGKIIPSTNPQVQIITGRANPQIAAGVLPMLKNEADEIVRIARTGVSQEPVAGTTATAVQLASEGQKRAEGSLADRASLAIEQCWTRIIELCRAHPVELSEAYPGLKDKFYLGLAQDCRVVATARASSANPAAQQQILADFWALVQAEPTLWDVKAVIKHIAESMNIEADLSQFWLGDRNGDLTNGQQTQQGGPLDMAAQQGDPGVPGNDTGQPVGDPQQLGDVQPQ